MRMPKLSKLLGVGALAAFLVAAAALRLAGFTRPYWLDEATHNILPLEQQRPFSLLGAIAELLQPALDFFLRAWFWFPLVTPSEGSFRLPSLLASLVSVAFVFVFSARFLGRNFSALAGAVFTGFWITFHTTEIFYAAEARHYALVALASLVWFAALVTYDRPFRARWFLLASLALMNLHFFALPLLLTAAAVEAVRELRARDSVEARRVVLTAAALTGFTILLNYSAFRELIGSRAVTVSHWRPEFWTEGLEDLVRYVSYLDLPGVGWAWLGGFTVAGLVARTRAHARIAAIAFVALPLFFVLARGRSTYPMFERYMSPFLGLGLALLLLTLKELYRVRVVPLFLFAVAGLLLYQRIPLAPWEDLSVLSRPTPIASYFEDLKKDPAPIIFAGAPCWTVVIPRLYWQYFGVRSDADAWFVRPLPIDECTHVDFGVGTFRQELDQLLKDHPTARVVLYQQNPPGQPLPESGVCDRDGCYLTLPAVSTAEEAKTAAAQLGFPIPRPDLRP